MSQRTNWTHQQWRDYNARMYGTTEAKGRTIKDAVAERITEANLHQQILDECARRGWIPLHGSMAHQTFRTPGEWDFTIVADKGRIFFIECKVGNGKLTAAQQAIHAWASKLGHTVYVVRSIGEFHALL